MANNNTFELRTQNYEFYASRRGTYLHVHFKTTGSYFSHEELLKELKKFISDIESKVNVKKNIINPSTSYRRFSFWSSPNHTIGFTVYLPNYDKENLFENLCYWMGENDICWNKLYTLNSKSILSNTVKLVCPQCGKYVYALSSNIYVFCKDCGVLYTLSKH